MSGMQDNYGPWLEEQPPKGFCVACYRERLEHHILLEDFLTEDEVNDLDRETTQKIKELNIKNLPAVICKDCCYAGGDLWEDNIGDEYWDDLGEILESRWRKINEEDPE